MANIGSLFKKTKKNDPEFLATQAHVRQSLLKTLSRAIKEVQLLFTELGEGGRVGDGRVSRRLCSRFESVLRHGQKARWFGQNSSFWPLVLQISRKQAIEYINSLQHAQTGTGKCRAWIRMAVNECSLESYIGVICQNSSLRDQHYEVHAFLRDEDVVGPLQQLLGGLSQINFNITVDTASLEFEEVPEALQPLLQLRPRTLLDNRDHRHKKKHRRHKTSRDHQATHIVDSSSSSGSEQSSDLEESGEDGDRDEGMTVEKGNLKSGNLIVTAGDVCESVNDGGEGVVDSGEDGEEVEGDMDERRHGEVESEEDVEGNIGEEDMGTHMEEEEMEGNIGEEGTRGEEVESNVIEEETERHITEEEVEGEEDGGTPIGEGGVEEEEEGDMSEEEEETHIGEVKGNEEKERGNTTDERSKVEVSNTEGEKEEEKEGERGWTECEQSRNNQEEKHDGILFVERVPMDGDVDGHQLRNDQQEDTWGDLTDNWHDEKLEEREGEDEDEMVPRTELERSGDHSDTTSTHLEEVPTHLKEQVTKTQAGTTASSDLTTSKIPHNPSTYLRGHEVPESGLAQMDQNSKNPFDLLEDDLDVGNVDMSSEPQDMAGSRNPFDSPEPADPPTLTSVSPPSAPLGVDSDTLDTHSPPSPPPPQSHPHRNPFGSSPSPPASPTSSDLFNEAVPTSAGHRGDEIWPKSSRSDSLEWSMLMEETLEEADSETLLSSLQLDENHYSPEMGIPELQEAILRLKKELSSTSLPPSEQHTRRKFIVQLQLKLHYKREEDSSLHDEEVSGHKFVRQTRQPRVLRGVSCVACKKKVRGLIREWYRCKICRSVCHKKCLPSVTCQCIVPGEDVKYIMEVCPERGLTDQQFRCSKCNRAFNQTPSVEPRLCDYDGLYYCSQCHNRDTAVIPARVMHNWDFTAREVCCQCSSLLFHLSSRPLLRVQEVNPLLYIHIQDLVEVEALRKDILQMKKYFIKCRAARDSRLLHELDVFPNFKDHPTLLTLHEMVEIQNGSLLPMLKSVHTTFAQHIKSDCQTCSERSHRCNLCSSEEPLYPFGHDVSVCQHCSVVYHKSCFSEVSSCSKCHKRK